MSRRPTIAQLQEQIRALQPFHTLWNYQHARGAESRHFGFTIHHHDQAVIDVRVSLWIGPRRAGLVVAEVTEASRNIGERVKASEVFGQPIHLEPQYAEDLIRALERSHCPYRREAARGLMAIVREMYEPDVHEIGDAVLVRGKHTTEHSIRGKVESVNVVPGLLPSSYGVRLENGNFLDCAPDQLRRLRGEAAP